MLAGGVLITPHTTVCDATLFLPGLLLARRMVSAPVRALAGIALTPLYLLLPNGALQVAVMAILVAAVWTVRGQAVDDTHRTPAAYQAAPVRSAIIEKCRR
jgi:thiamine monophosphate synthase